MGKDESLVDFVKIEDERYKQMLRETRWGVFNFWRFLFPLAIKEDMLPRNL